MLPGQRASAWLEMDVKANAVARRTRGNCRAMRVSCRPPLAGCESKATLAAISGYLNGLGVESMSMKCGKDVDLHNCWRLLNLNR